MNLKNCLDLCQKNLKSVKILKTFTYGTVKSVRFRKVFGLLRVHSINIVRTEFKLHRHLVDGTVKSLWFRQAFGLLRSHCNNNIPGAIWILQPVSACNLVICSPPFPMTEIQFKLFFPKS